MSARLSAGQRRAAKVRARRGRARQPERARGLPRHGRADGRQQPPEVHPPEIHPLEVLEEVDPNWPDEDVLRTALELAVVRTIATESPDAGEQVALRIDDLDVEYGEAVEAEYLDYLDGLTPTDPMLDTWSAAATYVLVEWLRTAPRGRDAAAVAERVLRWVEERLGRSGPGLEQEAILLGGPGASRPLDLERCLGDDLVAVHVWLLAGLAAVTGSDSPAAPVHPTRGGHAVAGAPTRRGRAVSSGDSATVRVSAETVGPER
jgi:hypothetical protein